MDTQIRTIASQTKTSIQPYTIMRISPQILIVLLCIGLSQNTFAQGRKDKERKSKKAVQVTLIPPIGTNGRSANQSVNHLSFNIIAGTAAGLDGFELGLAANIEKDFVKGTQIVAGTNIVRGKVQGVQLAGIANLADKKLRGAQFAGLVNKGGKRVEGAQFAGLANISSKKLTGIQGAGLLNIGGKRVEGAQMSGFANIAARKVEGVQFAGFLNIAGRKVEGAQVAGFMNASGKDIEGLQAAGFLNISDDIEGGQIAGFSNISDDVDGVQLSGFMNIADDIKGAQIGGFLNVADRVSGVQIGLINIARTVKGVPIGLISIVTRGYKALELSVNENLYAQASIKLGVRHFYNIFTGGYLYRPDGFSWGFGYGIGAELGKEKGFIVNIDLTSTHINDNEVLTRELNLLNQARIPIGYRFGKHFAIFVGPTFNIYATHLNEEEYNYLTPNWAVYEERFNRTTLIMWPGLAGGVRF